MKKFSERIGAEEEKTTLQVNNINNELRNSLWNVLVTIYNKGRYDYWSMASKYIAVHFRKFPVDELPSNNYRCQSWLKEYFFSLNWYELYNLIEFLVKNHSEITTHYSDNHPFRHKNNQSDLIDRLNFVLERELSAYRFISGILSPVSDKTEQNAISDAIQSSKEFGLFGAHEHLNASLRLIGKKPNPDYRNSIKEAISAVESIVKQITGSKSKGLDGAIEELSKKTNLHGALKSGFKKLYGYSSDSDGIRHAILEQPSIGFAEAKYMLVSCSAFVHYLIEKADQCSLLNKVN